MERAATAVWVGALKDGKGSISTQSGVLSDSPYSFVTRFENGKGTNPEELIAAAHAGCFTMALAAQLGTMNLAPESLRTTATVSLEKLDAGWTISKVHLDVAARLRGISSAALEAAATNAKNNCPVSRLLRAEITMTTSLEQAA
jgi:osmotically inducible protein OsmC